MQKRKRLPILICGAIAGAINGLFGAGGGMLLVPLLAQFTDLEDAEIFPASVTIIAPLCVISLILSVQSEMLSWRMLLPYVFGSAIGGVLAGTFAQRLSPIFLHKLLGILILWGGIRYLC